MALSNTLRSGALVALPLLTLAACPKEVPQGTFHKGDTVYLDQRDPVQAAMNRMIKEIEKCDEGIQFALIADPCSMDGNGLMRPIPGRWAVQGIPTQAIPCVAGVLDELSVTKNTLTVGMEMPGQPDTSNLVLQTVPAGTPSITIEIGSSCSSESY